MEPVEEDGEVKEFELQSSGSEVGLSALILIWITGQFTSDLWRLDVE